MGEKKMGPKSKEERMARAAKYMNTQVGESTPMNGIHQQLTAGADSNMGQIPQFSTQTATADSYPRFSSTDDGDPMLSAPLKERDYANGNDIIVDGPIPMGGIPEPETVQQRVSFGEFGNPDMTANNYGFDGANGNPYAGQMQGGGVDENMVGGEDLEIGTENLADTIVDGMKTGYAMIAKSLQKTQESLTMDIIRGKLDPAILRTEIDIGSESVPMVDFIKDYNQQVESVMVMSKDKEVQFKTLFKRICMKNGATMSDEARVGMLLLEEAISKGPIMFSLKRTMTDILKNQEAILKERRQPRRDEQVSEVEQEPLKGPKNVKKQKPVDVTAEEIKEAGE